jgi:hypothetical protein
MLLIFAHLLRDRWQPNGQFRKEIIFQEEVLPAIRECLVLVEELESQRHVLA